MADYLVQEDGTSKILLEDGSGGILLEGSAASVSPSFIASATVVHAPTLSYASPRIVVTTAGTFSWICPTGVTYVYVECYGAGGPGAQGGGNVGEGGGGGGAYAARIAVPVTPGTTYTFVVGSGGTPGVDGGSSSFTGDSSVQVIAVGGKAANDTTKGAGGLASASTGDTGLKFSGGDGGQGLATNTTGGAGGGASGNPGGNGAAGTNAGGSPGTAGGTGANGGGNGGKGGDYDVANATSGSSPGGGGGGAGGITGGAAGHGADGKVTITADVAATFIGSVTTVYAPTLTAAVFLHPPFIASATVVYAPAIPQVDPSFISSKTHVWGIFSLFDPNRTYGGPGNGGESFVIRLNANGVTDTATLALSITSSSNTVQLTGDGAFPTDKPFVVTIDSEVLLVFQVSLGNYHVRLRAVSNTTASSHTVGASVTWGDSYDMAIRASADIAHNFTADITSTGSFTYPGWLICFDSSQAYTAAGARYPMHVSSVLGVFDAGAGSTGTSRLDGPQPNAISTPVGASDDCPAALANPARIQTDIAAGDVAVVRYTNPEATVLDLGGRSTALQSWFGLKRVDTSDGDVTFTDPNGIVVDTTGTYDTFTGSVNEAWDPAPVVTGIAPDASDLAGVPISTPNPVPWTTVTLPHADRHFTRTAVGEKGWPMCCLAVRQGNRRVPFWQSWDWKDYAYVYDGFGTDCTYAQILINRNGIVFGSVPSVDLPNDSDIDGPDAVWDDSTYAFAASWYVAIFNSPYLVYGPSIGGTVIGDGQGGGGSPGGYAPGVTFGPGGTPTVSVPPVEGGSGGGIGQPLVGLHVWQTS